MRARLLPCKPSCPGQLPGGAARRGRAPGPSKHREPGRRLRCQDRHTRRQAGMYLPAFMPAGKVGSGATQAPTTCAWATSDSAPPSLPTVPRRPKPPSGRNANSQPRTPALPHAGLQRHRPRFAVRGTCPSHPQRQGHHAKWQ